VRFRRGDMKALAKELRRLARILDDLNVEEIRSPRPLEFEAGPDAVVVWGRDRPKSRPHWDTSSYDQVFERDGERCRYCGAAEHLTVDHVVPRCQGGSDDPDNLVVACRSCNSRKGGRTPQEAGMELLA